MNSKDDLVFTFHDYQLISDKLRHKQSFRQTRYRYLALFFACMIMLGDAYCFDNPMALQSQIQAQFHITNIQFNLLYTVYSLPNIILPFFGGLLIDRIGARLAILIFSTVILVGQVICVVGAQQTKYWLMILGRVIFGAGSESLNTSQNSIMAQWFKNKEMSLAIGLCISIPKVGSAINSLLSPLVVEKGGTVAESMMLGLVFLLFSYLCGLVLIYMDKESDKREKQAAALTQNFLEDEMGHSEKMEPEQVAPKMRHFNDKEFLKKTQQQYIEDSPDLTASPSPYDDIQNPGENQQEAEAAEAYNHGEEPKEEINFKDISKMSGTFWILLIICMLTEALFVPFLDNGNDFFQVRFGFSSSQAGEFLILPYLIAALVTPFLGSVVDRIGRRSMLIILTSFIFLGTHVLLLFLTCTSVCYVVATPLLCLGVCFAFYASVVIPSVPVVVDHKLIGTAFGLMGVFQNTALALFPLITGMLFNQFSDVGPDQPPDLDRGYMYQSYFFVGMSVFLLFISLVLSIIDRAGGKKLGASGHKKKIQEANKTPNLVPQQRPTSYD